VSRKFETSLGQQHSFTPAYLGPCSWLLFKRPYNPEQDIVGLLIEAAEHNRRAASLNSYDFGWQTAECGLSPAANLKHYLRVGAFGQREVLGFEKGRSARWDRNWAWSS